MKAFAKLNSCYEFIDGGLVQTSLIELMASVEEVFNFQQLHRTEIDKLWSYIIKSQELKSLCVITFTEKKESINTKLKFEIKNSNGLITNHGYIMTKLIEISNENNENMRILCLKNPSCDKHELYHKFSYDSARLNQILEKLKNEHAILKENDNQEFW